MVPTIKDQDNCIQSGSVIVEGVEHLVEARFVKCSVALNDQAWNTTERKERCLKCFPEPIKKRFRFGEQLELF